MPHLQGLEHIPRDYTKQNLGKLPIQKSTFTDLPQLPPGIGYASAEDAWIDGQLRAFDPYWQYKVKLDTSTADWYNQGLNSALWVEGPWKMVWGHTTNDPYLKEAIWMNRGISVVTFTFENVQQLQEAFASKYRAQYG